MNYEIVGMIIALLGGLGLFLFGMKLMGDGLELAAGARLRGMIEKLTKNKYMGALVGVVVTALIQSSSATTVMVVGFVNAGLMDLAQAVGVIMGANIGTTITAFIIAINLTAIAPLATFVGVVMMCFIKKNSAKHIGQIIAGFGILFMGMNIMSTAMEPLAQMPEFTGLLTTFSNPLWGVMAGMLFTALIQSSSASVGVLQALGSVGAITLPSAVYVIYGQNIGTCITALISCIGTSKTAKRTAVVHLLFNVIGAGLFIIIAMTLPFTQMIEKIVPNNMMMQISLVHTIFNVVCTAIMLPLSNYLIKIACKVITGEDPKKETKRLAFLDERVLQTPPMAVSLLFKEAERMGNIARHNFSISMDALINLDGEKIEEVYENEEVIDYLNGGITEFLIKVNELEIPDSDTRRLTGLYRAISDMERIGDHSENICELLQILMKHKAKFGDKALKNIMELSSKVKNILEKSMYMLINGDKENNLAKEISRMEEEIDILTEECKESHIERINRGECSAVSSTVYMDLLTNLERIADHANNIAFCMMDKQYVTKVKNTATVTI